MNANTLHNFSDTADGYRNIPTILTSAYHGLSILQLFYLCLIKHKCTELLCLHQKLLWYFFIWHCIQCSQQLHVARRRGESETGASFEVFFYTLAWHVELWRIVFIILILSIAMLTKDIKNIRYKEKYIYFVLLKYFFIHWHDMSNSAASLSSSSSLASQC